MDILEKIQLFICVVVFKILFNVKIYVLNWIGVGLLSFKKGDKLIKGKDYYETSFLYGTEIYHMRLPVKRGPSNIEHITVETKIGSGNNSITSSFDKTEELSKYSGPHGDFFGIKIDPALFGYSKIIVTYYTGNDLVFE
jgi:hypothetical protein